MSQSCRAVRHTELVIKGHINMGAYLAAACEVASAAHNTFWRYYPSAESYPGIVIKRGEKKNISLLSRIKPTSMLHAV